jgi:hypothetical protein
MRFQLLLQQMSSSRNNLRKLLRQKRPVVSGDMIPWCFRTPIFSLALSTYTCNELYGLLSIKSKFVGTGPRQAAG